MAEYIDRAEVIKYIEKKLDKLTDVPEMGARIAVMESAYNSTLNYIMQIPAVEIEPVVRCKDCTSYSGKYCTLTVIRKTVESLTIFAAAEKERKCRNDIKQSIGNNYECGTDRQNDRRTG